MSTLNAEALDTLTPEEREAIEGSDYTPEELATMQNLAGSDGSDDGDDEDDDDEDDDGGTATADPDASDAASEQGGSTAAKTTGDDGVDADVAAVKAAKLAEAQRQADEAAAASREKGNFNYNAQLPSDFQDRLTALDTKEAELKQKFRDGELEFDEFDAQRELLFRERGELDRLRTKAEISEEMRSQSAEYQWGQAVNGFIGWAANLPEGSGRIDYANDAEKQADLDAFVKTLAGNPANEQKDMRWFLDEAHKRVLALHDMSPAKAAPVTEQQKTETTAEEKLKQAKKDRKPDTTNLPPSIANVPGGDGPGDVGSEFADMDSLSGDQLEAAIRRMSPEQRERYSRGS